MIQILGCRLLVRHNTQSAGGWSLTCIFVFYLHAGLIRQEAADGGEDVACVEEEENIHYVYFLKTRLAYRSPFGLSCNQSPGKMITWR